MECKDCSYIYFDKVNVCFRFRSGKTFEIFFIILRYRIDRLVFVGFNVNYCFLKCDIRILMVFDIVVCKIVFKKISFILMVIYFNDY